jgi:hypothetical protein
LKTLADEAKTKIVVDFKDVEAKIDPPKPVYTPAPISPTHPLNVAATAALASVPAVENSAEKAFAAAEAKKS